MATYSRDHELPQSSPDRSNPSRQRKPRLNTSRLNTSRPSEPAPTVAPGLVVPDACRRERSVAAALLALAMLMTLLGCLGCNDDAAQIREIEIRRQNRVEAEANQDHLSEAVALVRGIEGLNSDKAAQQIVFHLNQWNRRQSWWPVEPTPTPTILKTVLGAADPQVVDDRATRVPFAASDVAHLRDAYLYGQVVRWADAPTSDDPLLKDWFDSLGEARHAGRIRRAARLFDWTVRNIALEPRVGAFPPGLPKPRLPQGMEFEGPGYRQTDFETLRHGAGDAQQRGGVFINLCRAAGIPAAFLAVQSTETGRLEPWAVGVLIGQDAYLFDPELGLPIPGPQETGIATLAQARTEPTVMRRLNLPLKKYRFTKDQIQQTVALLNQLPEGIAPRMQRLEDALTGDRRMALFVDVKELSRRFDAVTGISGVRLWKVPLLAERYGRIIQAFAEREPFVLYWLRSRWGIVDGNSRQSANLSLARWMHLHGEFAPGKDSAKLGARALYVNQRAPEFEIDDLAIDVNLQNLYGIRRELGRSSEEYQFLVGQFQTMLRQAKRAASYWIALVQYDDGRLETSRNWLAKRVLDPEKPSPWFPAARYNLGRVAERLGDVEKAVELYKTEGDPQEYGNRLRARLLTR